MGSVVSPEARIPREPAANAISVVRAIIAMKRLRDFIVGSPLSLDWISCFAILRGLRLSGGRIRRQNASGESREAAKDHKAGRKLYNPCPLRTTERS
jgi:hypothetical protein